MVQKVFWGVRIGDRQSLGSGAGGWGFSVFTHPKYLRVSLVLNHREYDGNNVFFYNSEAKWEVLLCAFVVLQLYTPPCRWQQLLWTWTWDRRHDAPWSTGRAHLHPPHQKEAATEQTRLIAFHSLPHWLHLSLNKYTNLSSKHFIKKYSKGPPVYRLSIRLIGDNLHLRDTSFMDP